MSEMLANRYFMAGRFPEAGAQFEGVLRRNPAHPSARRKLIVCHVLTGRLRPAVELAIGLLTEDPKSMLLGESVEIEFPCKLIDEAFAQRLPRLEPGTEHLSRAVLALFCDAGAAREELQAAAESSALPTEVGRLLDLVERLQETGHA